MKQFLKLSKREHLLDFLSCCLECTDPHELEELLGDVLTKNELIAIAERWSIAKLLHMGFSYRTITTKTGASTSTISRMARLLLHGSGRLYHVCQKRVMILHDNDPDVPSYPVLCRAFQ